MKQIPLSRGKFALVDDEDYDFLMQWKWSALKRNDLFHARRSEYIKNDSGECITKRIYMHRSILGVSDPKILVDHKDGDGLNNTRGNLRLCNKSQNGQNRQKNKNNKTGYKGVVFPKKDKKYYARIKVDGKVRSFGGFDCPIEAAEAYDRAAIEFYGEFAKTNF